MNFNYAIALSISAAISALIASIAWRRRTAPGAIGLTLFMLAEVVWAGTYAVRWMMRDPSSQLFWLDMTYFGAATHTTLVAIFALQFTGRSRLLTRRNLILLAVVPVLTLLLLWTDRWHGLFLGGYHSTGAILNGGPWFWFFILYSFAQVIVLIALFIQAFMRASGLYRQQVGVILIASIFPIVGLLIGISGISPYANLDLTPFTYSISGFIYAYGLFGFHMMDVVPVARHILVDEMTDGVIVLDANRRIVDVNPAVQNLIGISAGVIGQPATDVMNVRLLLDQIGGLEKTGMTDLRIAENPPRDIELQNLPLLDARQQISGYLLTLHDITERKQMEIDLQGSASQYRALIDLFPSGVVILSAGQIILANDASAKFFGADDPEKLIGTALMERVHPDYHEIVKSRIQQVANTLKKMPLIPEKLLRLDGTAFDSEVTAMPITYQGEPARLIVFNDITERQQAEQLLRESETRFREVLENSLDASYKRNLQTRAYEYLSPVFGKITGYSPEEFCTLPIETVLGLMHPEDGFEVERVMTSAISGSGSHEQHVEYRFKHKSDGEYRWLHDQFTVMRDTQGQPVALVGSVRDITERKQREEALREEEKLLKQLVIFTEELIKTGSRQVTYQKILDNLLYISKAKYGILTLLNENTGKFTTVAIAGMTDVEKKVIKILGIEPIGKEWDEYSTDNEKLKGQVVSHFSSLGELAGRVIPEMISRPIEDLLDMGEATVTKVIVNDQMIGDFTLIMPAGRKMENNYFIEIYSRQIDMFITREISDEQLKQSEDKHRRLIENSHDIIYTLTADGVFTFVSPSWTVLLGHPVMQVVGKTFRQFVHPDDIAGWLTWLQKVIKTGQRQEGIEYRVQHADGSWSWHTSSAVPLRDKTGGVIGVEGTARDITERKQTGAELSRAREDLESAHSDLQKSYAREQALARIDDLTGINNHRALLQLADREFDVAIRYKTPLSMMFLDIDFFKQINDTFGHLLGDQALKTMVQVICAGLRSTDVIGRYGGDEFIILLPQTSVQEALSFAKRIHASIAALCLDTEKGPLTLTISIGIAQTIHDAGHSDTVQSLFHRADQALYAAKEAGRHRTVDYQSITSAT